MRRLLTALLAGVALAFAAPVITTVVPAAAPVVSVLDASARADITPTEAYADFSLRGGGSLAPDADYPAWWNWYQSTHSTGHKLIETVGMISWRDSGVNGDHFIHIRYKIKTQRTAVYGVYEYSYFNAYWTPTSPMHGGGTYYDANVNGEGPLLLP